MRGPFAPSPRELSVAAPSGPSAARRAEAAVAAHRAARLDAVAEWVERHVDGREIGRAQLHEALVLQGRAARVAVERGAPVAGVLEGRQDVEGGDEVAAIAGVDDADAVGEPQALLRAEARARVHVEAGRRAAAAAAGWTAHRRDDAVVDTQERPLLEVLGVVLGVRRLRHKEVEARVGVGAVLEDLEVVLGDVGRVGRVERRGVLVRRVDVEVERVHSLTLFVPSLPSALRARFAVCLLCLLCLLCRAFKFFSGIESNQRRRLLPDDDLLVEVLPPLAERDAVDVDEVEADEDDEREEHGRHDVRAQVVGYGAHPDAFILFSIKLSRPTAEIGRPKRPRYFKFN